jgi:hypothetical protein
MLRSALLCFLLLTIPVRANLGDTVDACVKRYGKPIGFSEASAKSPFGTLVFVASNYTLVVFLLHDKEVGARVTKTDKSAFAAAELKTIMDADAVPPWVPVASGDPSCDEWTRSDLATIIYDKDKHIVIFTSTEMAEAIKNPPPFVAPPPGTKPSYAN